jgi:hypothetical protein
MPFGGSEKRWSHDQVHDDNWADANIRPSLFRWCPRVEAGMDCADCGVDGYAEDNAAVTHALFLGRHNARHAAADAISAAYFYPEEGLYNPDDPYAGE